MPPLAKLSTPSRSLGDILAMNRRCSKLGKLGFTLDRPRAADGAALVT